MAVMEDRQITGGNAETFGAKRMDMESLSKSPHFE